jgi:hypothetical protein
MPKHAFCSPLEPSARRACALIERFELIDARGKAIRRFNDFVLAKQTLDTDDSPARTVRCITCGAPLATRTASAPGATEHLARVTSARNRGPGDDW